MSFSWNGKNERQNTLQTYQQLIYKITNFHRIYFQWIYIIDFHRQTKSKVYYIRRKLEKTSVAYRTEVVARLDIHVQLRSSHSFSLDNQNSRESLQTEDNNKTLLYTRHQSNCQLLLIYKDKCPQQTISSQQQTLSNIIIYNNCSGPSTKTSFGRSDEQKRQSTCSFSLSPT